MQQLQFIVIGDPASPSFTFEGDDILSTSGDFTVDMIGAELCTDVMEAVVSYDDTDGTLRALPWATPVHFSRGEHLEGKLYLVSVTRTGKKAYRIRTTSAAGIMEYETFYGGMYTGETFKTVVEQVVGTNALQPFDGVYRHLIREKGSSSTPRMIGSTCMGRYENQAKTRTSDLGCFLSATMSSKLLAKIKILGFSNQSYNYRSGSPETICYSALLGAFVKSDAADNLKKHRYGLYMKMTRPSISDPFPDFGEVVFVYGQTSISLGTPASADAAVYEIEVNPGAGTAVINNETYPITFDSSLANDACALHVYGGGTSLYDYNGSVFASAIAHHCELESFFYTVRGPGGEIQADYISVKNIYTEKVGIYDFESHILKMQEAYSEVLPSDLEPYDVSIYGGSVLFNNRTNFQTDVLASLTYASGIDTLQIYGWIPICTKRQALQQLLFATGAILIKDENGRILFTAPSTQSAENINDDAIFDKGSEDQPEHINAVELTEHSYDYNPLLEDVIIYKNTTGSANDYYIAQFTEAPAKASENAFDYDLLTCVYSNCNAALVSGAGKILGRPYSHVKKVLRQEIASFPDGREVNVPDATLVTLLNSETVMDRLMAYYGPAHKTRVDIAQNGERCGLLYSLTSAFGESFSGFLVRASNVITSIVRAACEFVLGYTPPQIGGGYTNYVILTGTGTWTVPASVFEKETPRIHVVLIGGGKGGDGGFAGANGEHPEVGGYSQPAEGGAHGDSGSGGKIFEVTITNPAASYAYSCGQGGAGGTISYSHSENSPGSDGGITFFDGGGQSHSSASGTSSENGITNSITGERYAARLVPSYYANLSNYGSGGNGGAYDADENYHSPGNCLQTILNNTIRFWSGGRSGQSVPNAFGGHGGGAGYGQNGSNGSAATYSGGVYLSGDGGKGGDATETPPKATDYNPTYYGYGGLGGGGGGGGGAGGWVTAEYPSVTGTGGAGGYGGRGGDGGDGCVLIYY